jgi:uracil-DNA glycosylase
MTTQREPAFVIDPRARAMLAEMGVRVWMPADAAPSASQAPPAARSTAMPVQTNQDAASQPGEVVAVPVRREPPLRLPVMDAPPQAAQNTALGEPCYVIGNLPSEAASYDLVVLGEPCQGAAATLLVNLLKPLESIAPRIFIAHMVASHNDSVNLQDQLATIPAKLVLALGPHAAKALLDKAADGIPFSKLRGTVHPTAQSAHIVVTYHPQQLLRQPQAKASSWQDIRLARRTLGKS